MPPAKPSVTHGSVPDAPYPAENTARPLPIAVRLLGSDPAVPSAMSRSSVVPAAMPSET